MNYNYSQPQNYARPAQPMWGNRIRPVSSLEEVVAISIDFDGSVFYFPDMANNKIYTKQFNADGSTSIKMYEQKEIPSGQDNVAYVTREEFEAAMNQIQEALQQPKQQFEF